MRDIVGDLERWWLAGDRVALATVVDTSSSAPRGSGASLAVHPGGIVVGSVSGGCVESAVVETCRQVLAGAPPQLVTYGYSDDEALAVGLTCGGTIQVFVRALEPAGEINVGRIAQAVEADEPVAVATVVSGPGLVGRSITIWPEDVAGTLGAKGLDVAVVDDARGMLAQGTTGCRHYGPTGQRRLDDVGVFVEAFTPRPRMLVFGAIDFASAAARIGRFLGFRVTVCDARGVFATTARFPDADEVVVEWPHRYLADTRVDARTVICVLTHDPKFDVPLLLEALQTDAGYIGVMGSRRTHDDRVVRLQAAGVTDEQLARLHSPIGLDLGGRTPEETAISIAAEIVQTRWAGSGVPLSQTAGRIHHPGSPTADATAATRA